MKIEDITVTHNIFFVTGNPEKHICINFPKNQDTTSLKENKNFYDKSCKFAIYINNYNSEITPNLVSNLILDHCISDCSIHWVLEVITLIPIT